MRVWLQASPDFKGIKTRMAAAVWPALMRFKPALISKGLRQLNGGDFEGKPCFKPALISKGLRLGDVERCHAARVLQASPDFKGIKTLVQR